MTITLDRYLLDRGISSRAFAALVGIPRATVHNYRHGIRFPVRDNLAKIREATGGLVTADDFVAQPRADRAAPRPRVSQAISRA